MGNKTFYGDGLIDIYSFLLPRSAGHKQFNHSIARPTPPPPPFCDPPVLALKYTLALLDCERSLVSSKFLEEKRKQAA